MCKQVKKIITYFLGASALLVVPFFVSAVGTEMVLSPASGTFSVGQEFPVKVMVDPAGTKINVAEAVIKFDNSLLSVSNISKGASAFSLWTTEPEFSNPKGTITFGGGSPTPFTNKSTIITVTFKALKTGSADVSFESGTVLAADGKGTDVFSRGLGGSYLIQAGEPTKQPTQQPTKKPTVVIEEKPPAPEITSTSHKDSDKWYNKKIGVFSWSLPFDATSVRLLVSDKKDAMPETATTPPVNSYETDELEDGEWYFYVQLKNQTVWGEVGQKKIQIDTEPPMEFDIKLLNQGVHSTSPKLLFETNDELSGINYYEVSIGDGVPFTVYSNELTGGAYEIPPQGGGQKMVTVKVYDNAGNVREVKKELLIPVVVASTAGEEVVVEEPSVWTIENFLLLFFVFTTGAFLAVNVYNKRQFKKERAHMLREASEVREKTDRVFSAIHEELEDQINAMDKNPQLTPSERELLEKMKEVLDISEELIDTEIEDLRKIVRNGDNPTG